jgi:copper(I)-binding protein
MRHTNWPMAAQLAKALLMLMLGLTGITALAQPTANVQDARIRLLPGDLPLAGYFTLHNSGKQTLSLVSASSPAFAMAHLHRSMEQNGMSKMVPVAQLDIAPGASLQFAPGGYHLMLMHRQRTLQVGDQVPVVLRFADGSTLSVAFKVQPAGAP